MSDTTRTSALALLLAGSVCLAGCGGGSAQSPTGPTPASSTPVLRGSAVDPAGDALRVARVPVPPDVIATNIDIESGTARVVVQFATGTFNSETTWIQVLLDTDESAGTGLPGLSSGDDAANLGVDFWVEHAVLGTSTPRSGLVRCTTSNPSSCRTVTAVTATVGSDRVEFVFAVSLLADDGRLRSKTTVGSGVANVEIFEADLDVLPDVGLSPMLVR